jgi:rubredoxin
VDWESEPQQRTMACRRCGRMSREDEPLPAGLADGWEGAALPAGWVGEAPDDAVCPDCQPAAWVPRCRGVIESLTGERIDVEAMVARPGSEAMTCGWVDVSAVHFDDEAPADWLCPSCGGTDYELIRYFRPDPSDRPA